MLVILTIAYLFHGTIQAAPLSNILRDTPISDLNQPNQCLCPDQQRSLLNIIWSCLSTIFACTWVSVHPNIPPAGEGWWKSTFRRLDLMIWGVLAPEMIVYWAMKQWIGARKLEARYHRQGWTKTHGYFVQMGGFTLFKGDQPQGVLMHKRLASLLETGAIEFPKITEAEIEDRSKGDALSKALAVGQTSWFVMQCIARRAQGLIITELELATMGFAALNLAVYFLWWKKPLGVGFSVPVYLLEKPRTDLEKIGTVEIPEFTLRSAAFFARASVNHFWTSIVLAPARLIWATVTDKWALPKLLVFVAQFLVIGIIAPVILVYERVVEIFYPEQDEGEGVTSVPTCYSIHESDSSEEPAIYVTMIIASIFGSIHCAGWFFDFPTLAERTIWRICSAFTAVAPMFAVISFFAMPQITRFRPGEDSFCIEDVFALLGLLLQLILFAVDVVSIPVYVVARLLLLGEALAALRFLPPDALAVVEWVEFLPHI